MKYMLFKTIFATVLYFLLQGAYGDLTIDKNSQLDNAVANTIKTASIGTGGTSNSLCPNTPPLIKDLQNIACTTSELQKAVQEDDFLKTIAETNFFESLNPSDVVRSVEPLSFFNRSLTEKIEETHERYQTARDNYTLCISSYPSDVKKDSCAEQKTIDFGSLSELPLGVSTGPDLSINPEDISADELEDRLEDLEDEEFQAGVNLVFQNYSTVKGRPPLSFQVRQYKGEIVMCEDTKLSHPQRVEKLCGPSPAKKCEKAIPPTCTKLDEHANTKSGSDVCVSLEQFSSLSMDLLSGNRALETRYCPDGCSYYMQTLQRVYKKNGSDDDYCADSYLVLHCGPQKDESEYNLNIREIKNLCTDFNHGIACSSF